jgi:NADH-quinone oxidoreductase subunit M
MLSMVQRVFYGDLGIKSEKVQAPDLNLREHLALWPLVIIFLFMGVASPVFIKAIDSAGVNIAHTVNQTGATTVNFESAQAQGGQR